jgi:predicted DsbA family dithiol-disulfide isomerase
MQIDIVSDTVCPWCFIGKRRLEKALSLRPDIAAEIRWRAYRLDPTIPRGGIDRKTYMRAKFGDGPRAASMGETIAAVGAEVGIAFAFDRIQMRPDTIDSHRLIRWSAAAGRQDAVVERLFKAYFEDGVDIGDPAALVAIARDSGMDADLVEELLRGDADRALIEQEDVLAHRMGISGVPTFIFDDKFAISGAYESDKLVRVLDKVLAEVA